MAKYGFQVKCTVRDAGKYGANQKGLFAEEDIKKDQVVYICDPATCGYLKNKDYKTKDEIDELLLKHPECKEHVTRYATLVDIDAYDHGTTIFENRIPCECAYYNHSCDSNSGYGKDLYSYVATKDIKCGEELVFDFQYLATEASLQAGKTGLDCKCGSPKCRGLLRFDYYRDPEWIKENYEYAGPYMQKRIDELKTKWFSSKCYLKKYNNKTEIGLAALEKIAKNELVAKYLDPNNIKRESHYLRHSDNPTCYINQNGEVYAKENIEASTDLTLNFNEI